MSNEHTIALGDDVQIIGSRRYGTVKGLDGQGAALIDFRPYAKQVSSAILGDDCYWLSLDALRKSA